MIAARRASSPGLSCSSCCASTCLDRGKSELSESNPSEVSLSRAGTIIRGNRNACSSNELSNGSSWCCDSNSSCTAANIATSPSLHGEQRCQAFSLMCIHSINVDCCCKPLNDQLLRIEH